MRHSEQRDEGHVGAQRARPEADLREAMASQQLELRRLVPPAREEEGAAPSAPGRHALLYLTQNMDLYVLPYI